MISAALLSAAALAVLPAGAARFRAEVGGEPAGVAELRIACAASACAATWSSELLPPVDVGGPRHRVHLEVEVDREGRFAGGSLAIAGVAGATGVQGAVPSSLVEVVLLGAVAAAGGGEACVPFFEEEVAMARRACARRDGAELAAEVGGVALRIAPDADGFPREVRIGRFRWVRDAAARLPARGPSLAGARVAGPADPRDARRFCDVDLDPAPPEVAPAGLPPPRAAGASCREKTAAWLAEAGRRGLPGRTAVGVAWDGGAFVWHAWAEVRVAGRWVPVDPSFGQLPARGPRFTVGRYADDDRNARELAGYRTLRCWGDGRVE